MIPGFRRDCNPSSIHVHGEANLGLGVKRAGMGILVVARNALYVRGVLMLIE